MPSILNSDDGVVSGTSGLKSTGGNDGITAFQQNGSERMRIDSSGNVGIGTTSPSYKLDVSGIIRANSGYFRSTNTYTVFTGADILGTTGGMTSIGANPIVFGTDGTERMRINAGAPILCLSGGNTSATGTGIAFPATQSASTDANTLDDYEQGTWTTTMTPGTSGTITLNAAYNELSYTKIGRVVTVTGELLVSSVSSPVGTSASINNLPFAAANLTDSSGTAGFGITLFTGAAWSVSPARISESATTVTWQIDASTIAANYNLFISFSYISAD